MSEEMPNIEVIHGETCPVCGEKQLTLTEMERDVAFFGNVSLFSMSCKACKYHKADVEALEEHDPCRIEFTVSSEDDLSVRVIRSSHGVVKFGRMGSIESGEAANGFITNIEGLINRFKKQVEFLRDSAEDKEEEKKAKNLLKKIQRVLWGQEELPIIIEDPTGNSAIISEKTLVKKLAGAKKKS